MLSQRVYVYSRVHYSHFWLVWVVFLEVIGEGTTSVVHQTPMTFKMDQGHQNLVRTGKV